jgi:tetratricopeptide (TPR) repeat protein
MSYLQKAYEQNKEHPHILIDLACALCNLGQHEEAETILRRVIAKYPNKFSSAYGSLGIALSAQKKMEESLKNLEQALLISPNDTRHQQNLSCCYLLNAELEKGWKAGLTCFINKFKEKCIIPFWTGQDLKGKTLLVANEQGIGDTLQYLRYIPLLQQKGVRIILDLRPFPFLKTLFTRSLSKETILYENGMKADYVSSITLLGLICETTSLSSIPATVPYLTPSPYKMSDWKHFFAKDPLYKVGLVWKGNPNQSNDSTRSTTLERLAPLSEATNCSFYGIQKDHSEKPPANMRFTDLSSKLKTFDDTAAILMHLDLLITVDTSVAHLGGALARPMWVILGHPPAQQWLLEREDSPWYPTAKLFRSKSHNGWDPVIQGVKNDLILLSKKNELL